MVSDMIVEVMRWIGTIAFAVSGALVAIGCSLDLFGVMIIGRVVYYVLSVCVDYRVTCTFVAVGLTVLIRLLAAKYHWKLPKITF